jgi:hypothetical protein
VLVVSACLYLVTTWRNVTPLGDATPTARDGHQPSAGTVAVVHDPPRALEPSQVSAASHGPAATAGPGNPLPGEESNVGRPDIDVSESIEAPRPVVLNRDPEVVPTVARDDAPIAAQAAPERPAPPAVEANALAAEPVTLPDPPFTGASDRDEYVRCLAELSNSPRLRSRQSMASAERTFQTASRLCDSDPRLFYFYGLILEESGHFPESLQQYEQATDAALGVYLPAWLGRARLEISHGDYPRALETLRSLAGLWQRVAPGSVNEAVLGDDVRTSGRAMGFLLGVAPVPEDQLALLVAADLEIQGSLNDALRDVYEAGRLEAVESHRDLVAADLRVKADAAARRGDRVQQQQADVQQRIEKIGDRREQIEMTVEEWNRWIRTRTTEIDAELSEFERQLSDVGAVREALLRVLWWREGQIQTANNQLTGVSDPGFLKMRIEAETRVKRLREQRDVVNNVANTLSAQALGLLAERKQSLDRYHQTTGRLLEEHAGLRQQELRLNRWKDRLGESVEDGPERPTIAKDKAEAVQEKIEDLEAFAQGTVVSFQQDTASRVEQLQKLSAQAAKLDARRRECASESLMLELLSAHISAIIARSNPAELQIVAERFGLVVEQRELTISFTMRSEVAGFLLALVQTKTERIEKFKVESEVLLSRMAAAHRQAMLVLARQRMDEARYTVATGEIVQQHNTLKEWERILSLRANQAAQPQAAAPARPSTPERLRSIRTYMKPDYQLERQRLLASYQGR